jgi:hypothetical protein
MDRSALVRGVSLPRVSHPRVSLPRVSLSGVSNVACTAARGCSRDSASCVRCDGRFRARRGAVISAKGNVAASNARLDLGCLDGECGHQFVLDPSDPAARAVEPDPSVVDLHAGGASARGVAGACAPRRRSPPHHDHDLFRSACYRRIVHAAAGADHAFGDIWPIAAGCKTPLARSLSHLETATSEGPAEGLVSLWKNEGKIRARRPVRGGLDGLDTLYDSHQEFSGLPLCLTLKIRSPESRRRLPIFVPYPSSTR